ncbi:hypothetical protein EI94DRAFT_1794789 [Lactarius quietus]|nr:hypothetical protein EI94DRAFT_1794789 [Lactarius quietus]
MALSRHSSLSPTPSYDHQITNPRKRPSVAQLQRLQTIFDASRYISKEERDILAHEIGLDVKFITVWFQNRRQSDKRKAWTKKDRARKKENTCHKIQIHTVFSKPVVSLDQIASRLERVQSPALSDRPRTVLSTHNPENSLEPATPTRSKPEALWAHMPSSPPDAPSSPASDGLQSMTTPCLVKSGKSLEWACAKERMGNKHRIKRDKGTRQLQRPSPRKPPAAHKKEQGPDSDSDQDTETPTPAQSQASSDSGTPSGAKAASESRPDELRGKSTKDVEAAMALLQFLRG